MAIICINCQREGRRSTVLVGAVTSKLGDGERYYDKYNNYHNHDTNSETHYYHCTNGHSWTVNKKPKCPSCSFGSE